VFLFFRFPAPLSLETSSEENIKKIVSSIPEASRTYSCFFNSSPRFFFFQRHKKLRFEKCSKNQLSKLGSLTAVSNVFRKDLGHS